MELQLEEGVFALVVVDKDLQHLKEFNLENYDTIERVVSRISRELEEMGQSEIQSSIIGKKVMDALKELDKIAYIRFASVYTNFKEVQEFEDYIEELDGKPKKK